MSSLSVFLIREKERYFIITYWNHIDAVYILRILWWEQLISMKNISANESCICLAEPYRRIGYTAACVFYIQPKGNQNVYSSLCYKNKLFCNFASRSCLYVRLLQIFLKFTVARTIKDTETALYNLIVLYTKLYKHHRWFMVV